MIDVAWDSSGPSVFAVTIQVEALDRTKLLRDITEVLSDHHVNIVSATVATGRDRIATLRFTFELADISHLAHVLAAVKRVDGVYDAFRVVPQGTGSEDPLRPTMGQALLGGRGGSSLPPHGSGRRVGSAAASLQLAR
jgi:GTP pyrophosphokinase